MARRTHRPLTVVALLMGIFLAAMETTVVSTAMPTAAGDLGGIHLYAWVFAAYLLAATVTMPIFGKLADLYGRKPVMFVGLALFLSGSFLCGRAGDMTSLILFRAIQGLGAGAVQPIAMTIVGDLFDVHRRARIQGALGAVWGAAGLIGPVLGGAVVHWLSWRWVFYMNLPPGLGCAAILFFSYHETVERREHRLDVAGAALLALSIVLALLGTRVQGKAIALFAASAVSLAAFVRVERRAAEPILPFDLFAQRVIAVAMASGALVGAAMMSAVTFVPLYVQAVLSGTPYQAGSAIATVAVGWPISSALAGRLLPVIGYRVLIRSGLALTACAAAGLWLLLRPGADLWAIRTIMLFYGLGMGLANTPLIIAVQSSVPWKRRGVATATTLSSRTIGGTLAVGTLGSVLAAERSLLQEGMDTIFLAVAAIAIAGFAVSLLFPFVAIAPRGGGNAPGADTAE